MIKARITEIPNLATPQSQGLPDLTQSRYTFNSSVFPSDLGRSDLGHYMIININVQTKNGTRDVAGNYGGLSTNLRELSKIDQLRFGSTGLNGKGGTGSTERPLIGGSGSGISTGISNALSGLINLSPIGIPGQGQVLVAIPRTTTRIAESIAMHMPTPLVFNTHNVYEEVSLTALAGKLGIRGAQLLGGAGGQRVASALGNITNAVGQAGGTIAQIAQSPINPLVEILFSTVAQRQFTFELLLAPRNEIESETIKNIIKTLRFHAAPEIGALGGLLWIPPAEFDITFFNKGAENPHLLRINTCVLERIEVDYAPTSGTYSTFRNGHPVAVRLSLGFRELEPLHKERILQGF